MRPPVLLLVAAALLPAPQEPTDLAEAPLAAGRAALEAGQPAAAARHLLVALARAPADPEVLALLLRASERDADARALWTQAWYDARADAEGRASPSVELRALLAEDTGAAEVAATRARAVDELLRLADARERRAARRPGERLVALWSRRLAMDLASASPALEELCPGRAGAQLEAQPREHQPVLQDLQRVLASTLSNRRSGEAVRAARCLAGLARQAELPDLQGEKPSGMKKYADAARTGLERARAMQREDGGRPWTVEELEYLLEEEGEAFTREHSSFADPGVALTPNERYHVETSCGYETLLGVARTAELHHERLAGWYGEDPFLERQGTIRVVPEATGLEAEGAPYWWVGGFQGGDTTTLRFSCGTIEGFGRGLTHELTHRFDGAIYPGLPAWLAEGKAVWTGGSYVHSTDPEFRPRYVSFGTVEGAFIKGYGGEEKLRELVEGTIEDYRDNYVAGYALYVYLATWEVDGRPLFAPRLEEFQRGCRDAKRGALERFVACFADGKEGRPEDFAAFAAGFAEFVKGFYWQDRADWTSRYESELPGGFDEGYVYDAPTWVWSRRRAEPAFGEGQARLAAELLLELGKREEAARAFVWGLAVDGRTPAAERELARLLDGLGRDDAAWVLRQALAFPDGGAAEPPPFAGALGRTQAHLAALEEAAAALDGQGAALAAAALAADRDRLALWLGEPALRRAPPREPGPLHPFDRAPRRLGRLGWSEDGLTDYEERRVEGLWYVDEAGDLHVGRERPRSGTGRLDRASHQRHAFVLTEEHVLPGTYRVRARLRMTTSYLSGAIVLGYTRRDRNVRLQLSAGDFLYAIGESEAEPKLDGVDWSLHGLRDRDYALPGSVPGGHVAFDSPRTAFEVELLVDGGAVQVFVDGEPRGTWHTADGAPVEGRIGFATSMGALEVQEATLQRLDRSKLAGRSAAVPPRLALAAGLPDDLPQRANRLLAGLEPSPNGRLLLWIGAPPAGEDGERWVSRTRGAAEGVAQVRERELVVQPWAVVVPRAAGEERIAALRAALAEALDPPPPLLVRDDAAEAAPVGDEEDDEAAGGSGPAARRTLVFVDSSGLIRASQRVFSHGLDLPDRMLHWLHVFRENGRPPRELPPVPRGAEPEPEEGGAGADE